MESNYGSKYSSEQQILDKGVKTVAEEFYMESKSEVMERQIEDRVIVRVVYFIEYVYKYLLKLLFWVAC